MEHNNTLMLKLSLWMDGHTISLSVLTVETIYVLPVHVTISR